VRGSTTNNAKIVGRGMSPGRIIVCNIEIIRGSLCAQRDTMNGTKVTQIIPHAGKGIMVKTKRHGGAHARRVVTHKARRSPV